MCAVSYIINDLGSTCTSHYWLNLSTGNKNNFLVFMPCLYFQNKVS